MFIEVWSLCCYLPSAFSIVRSSPSMAPILPSERAYAGEAGLRNSPTCDPYLRRNHPGSRRNDPQLQWMQPHHQVTVTIAMMTMAPTMMTVSEHHLNQNGCQSLPLSPAKDPTPRGLAWSHQGPYTKGPCLVPPRTLHQGALLGPAKDQAYTKGPCMVPPRTLSTKGRCMVHHVFIIT